MANQVEVEIVARLDKLEKAIKQTAETTTKQFETLSDDVSEIFEGGIGNSAARLAKSFAPIAIGLGALKVAIDSAFEGEKIAAINAQFEILAQQAGLTANVLKDELAGSAAGLIDDTDLIESANKALISLGAAAADIPKTLDLARKASALFGGEVTQNFELINQAVASGNTRSLRQIGLFIDQEQAIKDYAKALGVSVGAINETGKQQAILNAVLEKGQSVFSNVDLTLNRNKNALQELKVAFNDITDGIAGFANNTLGGLLNVALSVTAKGIKDLADGFKALSAGPETSEQRLKSLSVELENINKLIEKTGSTIQTQVERGDFGETLVSRVDLGARRAQIEAELEKLAEIQQKASARAFRPDAQAEIPSPFNVQKAEADAIKVQQIINKAQQDNLASQLAAATQEQERDAIIAQQKLVAAEGFALARREFLANEAINNQLTDAQEKFILEQMEQTHQNNLLAIKTESAKKQEQLSKTLGSVVNQGFASAITSGVQSFILALSKGENAFGAFVKTIGKSLGQVAITMGSTLIAAGLGIEALKGLQGGAAIAAGIALVALGTILSAISGAGEANSTPAGGGASGGGAVGGGLGFDQTSPVAQQTEFNPAQLGTQIAVNVQGNILNTRESALEIVSAMQTYFDTNGNTVVGATS